MKNWTRRITLVSACLASTLAGMTLVWLFAPRSFRGLSTLELIAIFAMIILPILAVLAIRADRRAQRYATMLQRHHDRLAAADAAAEQTTPQRAENRSVIHEPAYENAPSQQRA